MTPPPQSPRPPTAAAPADPAPPAAARTAGPPPAGRPRLLFLVTEDWYFRSHRLPVARAARDAGIAVAVATRVGSDAAALEAEGFRVIPLGWRRGSRNPVAAWCAVRQIAAVYRRERPDLVHHVSMKPILLGSLAAWLAGVARVVNAPTGLGHVFIARGWKAALMRWMVATGLGLLINRAGSRVIIQNGDDLETLRAAGVIRRAPVALIGGSGVDLARFRPGRRLPTWDGGPAPVAVMVSRMLIDKGVRELAEAGRILKARGVAIDIRLVGPVDPENPACLPESTLRGWQAAGLLTWVGPRRDIPEVLAAADIAVLPSYREGLPKALLEAAACGLPLVATDVPGCREVCRHGETGLLCPVRDAAGLADALQRLAGDPGLRARFGAAARHLVEARFSDRAVADQTLALYRALLSDSEDFSIG